MARCSFVFVCLLWKCALANTKSKSNKVWKKAATNNQCFIRRGGWKTVIDLSVLWVMKRQTAVNPHRPLSLQGAKYRTEGHQKFPKIHLHLLSVESRLRGRGQHSYWAVCHFCLIQLPLNYVHFQCLRGRIILKFFLFSFCTLYNYCCVCLSRHLNICQFV